jgi:hypothetical protein
VEGATIYQYITCWQLASHPASPPIFTSRTLQHQWATSAPCGGCWGAPRTIRGAYPGLSSVGWLQYSSIVRKGSGLVVTEFVTSLAGCAQAPGPAGAWDGRLVTLGGGVWVSREGHVCPFWQSHSRDDSLIYSLNQMGEWASMERRTNRTCNDVNGDWGD